MKARLLVVNDDATQQRLAQGILEREGYVVETSSGAAEALARLDAGAPVAGIVTDLHMPGIDGWRFCRLLRSPAYPRFNDLPILVMSATFHGEEAARLTSELGANAFLPAPYRPRALLHAVQEMLAGRRPVSPVTALLVGAADGAREGLEKAFAAHGYVVSATAGRAGVLRALDNDPPDVVVLEHPLADGSVQELLGAVKRPGSPCAAVVLTREQRAGLALELVRAGADAHVGAPFEPAYVVEMCERIRRQRALLRVEELLENRTQELRESELRFRSIFRALPDLVLVYGEDGTIVRANRPAEDALGYERLVGRDVAVLVPKAHRQAFTASRSEPWVAGVRRYETVFETAAGARLEVQVAESPFRLAEGAAVLAVARDVSRERSTERSRTLLASALEQVSEVILITDRAGRIQYAKPAFERTTGYGPGETEGGRVDHL